MVPGRALVEVGVLLAHRVPKPHGADRPTGAPTKAALFDACPAHGLPVATPAATARKAQVFIMIIGIGKVTWYGLKNKACACARGIEKALLDMRGGGKPTTPFFHSFFSFVFLGSIPVFSALCVRIMACTLLGLFSTR